MTKRERVETVIQGLEADYPPVSFWYHFRPDLATGQAAVDAHLRHQEGYDLDFVKVMNDHEYPREDIGIVGSCADLKKIKPRAGDTGELGAQLAVLEKLSEGLGGDILTCTTVFNPWAILRKLVMPESRQHGPPKMDGQDERDDKITALLQEDRSAVAAAVGALAETLADFSRMCISAGADGIFLSVRDDWVNRPGNGPDTYNEIVRPADLKIIESVQDAPFNFLHICGRPQDFQGFAEYPVQVINWADRSAGPSIAYARDRVRGDMAIAGGVDNLETMPNGSPEDCADEVVDSLRQANDRPIMITPGCTFDPDIVPEENLQAIVAAAHDA
ncbi:MAG: uroporphyrinogen decarboxylase family protein [Planctomycetota bacterium]